MTYEAMAGWLRSRMLDRQVRDGAALIDMLAAKKCSVHPNMVTRWLAGRGRPQGHRLEVVMDVLGVVKEDEREAVRKLAYFPPNLIPNRPPEDEVGLDNPSSAS